MAKCDSCGQDIEVDDATIECPTCAAWCCADCIAGKGVDCFNCEDERP